MRMGGYAGIAVLAALVASCGSGSGNSNANNVSAMTPCVVAPQTSTTTPVPLPSVPVIGGTPVPRTVVQPRCLPSGHIADALQVAAAIRATGLGCDTVDLDHPKPTHELPGRGPLIEQVSCDDVQSESVGITLAVGPTIDLGFVSAGACFVNKTHQTNLTYVSGTNWMAFPETAATAHLLADRMHQPVRTIHC